MLFLYATTLFVSAALLFLVEPMFARMVLPRLGGSPAVWNTALVFYQGILLAAYAYAHGLTARLAARRQVVIHMVILFLPLFLLPIAIPGNWIPPANRNPTLWLCAIMLITVGLPFFAVSASTPMLQQWFAASGHPAAADPYFLYGASNLGSLIGLLAYPALVEPNLRLTDQSRFWAVGYALLVALFLGCGWLRWRVGRRALVPLGRERQPSPPLAGTKAAPSKPEASRRARWVLLSFLPSSLMMGVTTFLSTEIAPIPLLWVLPLAIYLVTLILAFAQRSILPHRLMVRSLPILMVPLVMSLAMRATEPIAFLVPLHLITFFIAAMVCHGEISRDRPPAMHLTDFYFWLAVGGTLGGVFNALAAPVSFRSVAEYPITLVLICLFATPAFRTASSARERRFDFGWPLAVGSLTLALAWSGRLDVALFKALPVGLIFGLPSVACFFLSARPIRFGATVAAILLASRLSHPGQGVGLHAERSFFGVHRVTLDASGGYHQLFHGNTLHGLQSVEPRRRHEALTYYHRTGSIGQVFEGLDRLSHQPIAVVGLGAGSLATYGVTGQPWVFYEIDPVVEGIARNPRYFTFLQDSAASVRVVLGDARLSLAAAPRGRYGLIVLDAYSSDSVPVHLITREAVQIYLEKLAPHGLLAFHLSNRHLDLEPVAANLARDARLACLVQDDAILTPAETEGGKTASLWMLMARVRSDFGSLKDSPHWEPEQAKRSAAVWTDDYSSVIHVIVWH